MTTKRFGLVGAAGFVAPRHMAAIQSVGGELVAALDPSDNVGVLDRYSPHCRFFTQPEIFDRHLEKLRREGRGITHLSVCSPNYLHDAHARMAMRVGADAIVEKPLVLSPWNLDQLAVLEEETGRRVWTTMQLRLHPVLRDLKMSMSPPWRRGERHRVELTYVTGRGRWYDVSWKGRPEYSGGLAMNLGVHFFDALLWIFGQPTDLSVVHLADSTGRRMAGRLTLERADVTWFLSVNAADLPEGTDGHAFRRLDVGGSVVDFSYGFDDLHIRAYEEILAGRGLGLEDARPVIELLKDIRDPASLNGMDTGLRHPKAPLF